jgi:hypothetical protein
MPLITYICNNHECRNTITKSFKPKDKIAGYLDCGCCSVGKLERQLGAPSSVTKTKIDNGINARPVEIYENIVEMNEERSRQGGKE